MADSFIRGKLLGEGTWGSVYEAIDKRTNERVAIKRIKQMDAHLGVNFTALREIKHLKYLRSPNIVNMKEVFVNGNIIHLVLEFCPYDLEKIICDKNIFLRPMHIKRYLQMILCGVEHCHKHFVLHRDLKPANLLIGDDGQVKLADFGLARCFSSPDNMTSEVVTSWYRAPELLFGAKFYSVGIDIWAIGCIFAEMILRTPLFPGDSSDIDQLAKIFNVLGTPTKSNWPNVELLSNYIEMEAREPMNLAPLFGRGHAGKKLLDLELILKMLNLDPCGRIDASKALADPYFFSAPLPCAVAELPTLTTNTNNDILPNAKRLKST
eukprot:gene13244-17750_t